MRRRVIVADDQLAEGHVLAVAFDRDVRRRVGGREPADRRASAALLRRGLEMRAAATAGPATSSPARAAGCAARSRRQNRRVDRCGGASAGRASRPLWPSTGRRHPWQADAPASAYRASRCRSRCSPARDRPAGGHRAARRSSAAGRATSGDGRAPAARAAPRNRRGRASSRPAPAGVRRGAGADAHRRAGRSAPCRDPRAHRPNRRARPAGLRAR